MSEETTTLHQKQHNKNQFKIKTKQINNSAYNN